MFKMATDYPHRLLVSWHILLLVDGPDGHGKAVDAR
jgi:hypothetical protein